MKLGIHLPALLAAAALSGAFVTSSRGQSSGQPTPPPPAGSPAATAKPSPAIPTAADLKKAPPLTEEELRTKYVGKLVFLRGSYMGDNLEFDENGRVKGSPQVTSFTLCALEVRRVHLSKHKLDIEADRYGLHFFGALPYEDDSKPYDKVKLSKKPVHITIERELVVIPKVKKIKKKGASAPPAVNNSQLVTREGQPAKPAPVTDTSDSIVAVSPAHSAMLMRAALDNTFSSDIDPRMLRHLPSYWQAYFDSKATHRQFMPSDPSVRPVSEGMTPPVLLNSIDPSSNEYAQKFGITGMALFRTVVDASGKPQEIAIARPIGFGLDENAVRAIQNSRFRPAMRNGQPAPVVIDLVVTFRIYSNRTRPGSVRKGAKPAVLSAWAAGTDGSAGQREPMLQ